MQSEIKIFLKVTFFHSFYENKKMRNLVFRPTPQTVQFMRKAGLYSRTQGNELMIGCNLAKTPLFFDENTKQIMLVFRLNNSNPYFQSISDIPIYPPNEHTFYFDNLTNEEKLQLTKNTSGIVSEKDLFKVGSPLIDLTQSQEEINKISMPNSEIIYPNDSPNTNESHVNLSPYLPNLFNITKENTTENIYCFSNPMTHHFGMLHLYFDKEMLSETHEYEINFAHRHTYWRYYFIGEKITEQTDISIENQNNNTPFALSDTMKILRNGQQARTAISTKPIAQIEKQYSHFQASIVLDIESGKRITITLPNPDPSRLSGEKVGEELRLYSDIYVIL